MRKALAVIPARGGSKGVSRKNLRLLGGHPLVAWAIAAARGAKEVAHVVVSSDDAEILRVAEHYGAEALERPAELAVDRATDAGVLKHARAMCEWVGMVAYLRPTTPLRDPVVLDRAVRLLRDSHDASGVRSVQAVVESPLKWFGTDADGWLKPVSHLTDRPRQECPPEWIPNGYVDVFRLNRIGKKVLGVVVRGVEIDDEPTLDYLRYRCAEAPHPLQGYLDARQAFIGA